MSTHLSSDGTRLPGKPRRGCGCQSCRSEFGPPPTPPTCNVCGELFTERGPGAQSLSQPGTCTYCYENPPDGEEDAQLSKGELRAKALEQWASDELEIDDDAEVSYSGDGEGAWVAAWVFVRHD